MGFVARIKRVIEWSMVLLLLLLLLWVVTSVTIGRFFALRATIESRWQQLFYPNRPHCKAIFVKVSKSFIFLVKSFLGNFYRHVAIFIWSHWLRMTGKNWRACLVCEKVQTYL